jgi:hypothetical protein
MAVAVPTTIERTAAVPGVTKGAKEEGLEDGGEEDEEVEDEDGEEEGRNVLSIAENLRLRAPLGADVAPVPMSRSRSYSVQDLLAIRAHMPEVSEQVKALLAKSSTAFALDKAEAERLGQAPWEVCEREGGHGRMSMRQGGGSSSGRGGSGRMTRGGGRMGGGPRGDWRSENAAFSILKRAKEAFGRRAKSRNAHEEAMRAVRSLCNKLTRENFDRLVQQLVDVEVTSLRMLEEMVTVVFDKALEHKGFQDVFAKLVVAMDAKSTSWTQGFVRPFHVTEEEAATALADHERELKLVAQLHELCRQSCLMGHFATLDTWRRGCWCTLSRALFGLTRAVRTGNTPLHVAAIIGSKQATVEPFAQSWR